MPEALARLFAHGNLGVNIFFALSGFVIAMSVRDEAVSWGYAGRFTLRRSIRLDPPMWAAIALELVLVALSQRYFSSVVKASMPSLPQVASNMVYVQEFLGYAHISPVFWTLCYEIQFYVTFVLVLVTGAWLGRRIAPAMRTVFVGSVFATLFVASLLLHEGVALPVPRGVGLMRWSEFFLGVMTFWVCAGRMPKWIFALAAVLVLVVSVQGAKSIELLMVSLTCTVCAVSYLVRSVDRMAGSPVLQTLGRISYSTYLYHGSLGYRTVSLGQYLFGASLTAITGPLLWLVSLAVAVGGSAILWYLVERPTVALSRRVGLTARSLPLDANQTMTRAT